MITKLMLAAILLLRGKTVDISVEWGLEADHDTLHLYCDNKSNSVRIPLTSGTQFIAHTHPDAEEPYPSPADIKVAKKSKLYDLVVSSQAAYLIHPDGTVEKID
jgi:proteasome lid subunit RPN8/RPN11